MKSYVIYLPHYETSSAWARHALDTAQQHNWNAELCAGVDGRTVKDDQDWQLWGIKINNVNAKCSEMMSRPGVRGCFLSHYSLWKHCIKINEPIGIFEHDIEFLKPQPNTEFEHVLKLEGFSLKKPRPAGEWYEGARAYLLTPAGAQLLINWVEENGAVPADVCIGLDVVDVQLWDHGVVQMVHRHDNKRDVKSNSFTWNLEQMV